MKRDTDPVLTIDEICHQNEVYYPTLQNTHLSNMQKFWQMYRKSIEEPEMFWGEVMTEFYWKSGPKGEFWSYNFDLRKGPIHISWLKGAVTNITYNLLERNIERGLGDSVAFYWEGNDPEESSNITYKQLLQKVCKFSNVLKNKGVKKGECVAIYMPMILELIIAMLACARIGAVHTIVFGGYSAEALAGRILDARCPVLITADGVWRGTKLINLKEIANSAVQKCLQSGHRLTATIVVLSIGIPKRNGDSSNYLMRDSTRQLGKRPVVDLMTPWDPDIDVWWHLEMSKVSSSCEPEWMDAEDLLFLLYTSGSTGKPKGIAHTIGGYMIQAALSFKYVFDFHPGDVFFCTADIGWLTGHTYTVYGALLNGASSIIYEGVPCHPDPGRYWKIVDKYSVCQFYTAPTVLRTLMKYSDTYVKKYNRESLHVLGSVGEPLNPEVWLWYYHVVGNGNCSIVDTFWQTESGSHVLTSLPGCTPMKPGSSTFPFFGVVPALVDENGKEIEGAGRGNLVFRQPWPSMFRTIYENQERYELTYFTKFPGYYFTGDGAVRDSDGYYWIIGRTDDMLNVSGHLLSTSELESVLIEHKNVVETAAVACPHPIKGECLYCFIVVKDKLAINEDLIKELKQKVREKIGSFATPEYFHFTDELPKTRSGKIMRRILRKIATNDGNLGDVSTLANESIIEDLKNPLKSKVYKLSTYFSS
ncbi:acetyl-coenzyme A synthetase, cytoplasmic-like [Centruroides vittatus]|uniref:acetyl-coenzyme A synthetase, cytoplasmic-like n=1 Tax=Centruroides vittatus TaxID=120091 RepID=UPI00350F8BC1